MGCKSCASANVLHYACSPPALTATQLPLLALLLLLLLLLQLLINQPYLDGETQAPHPKG
jgi:hypothetical protein